MRLKRLEVGVAWSGCGVGKKDRYAEKGKEGDETRQRTISMEEGGRDERGGARNRGYGGSGGRVIDE